MINAAREHISNLVCVIQVAGPFASIFRLMLEACSAEEAPYVDLNGEVFRAIEELVAHQPPSIPVGSGAAFGVVASESAAVQTATVVSPEPCRIGKQFNLRDFLSEYLRLIATRDRPQNTTRFVVSRSQVQGGLGK